MPALDGGKPMSVLEAQILISISFLVIVVGGVCLSHLVVEMIENAVKTAWHALRSAYADEAPPRYWRNIR